MNRGKINSISKTAFEAVEEQFKKDFPHYAVGKLKGEMVMISGVSKLFTKSDTEWSFFYNTNDKTKEVMYLIYFEQSAGMEWFTKRITDIMVDSGKRSFTKEEIIQFLKENNISISKNLNRGEEIVDVRQLIALTELKRSVYVRGWNKVLPAAVMINQSFRVLLTLVENHGLFITEKKVVIK